jgi:hypothetical protein
VQVDERTIFYLRKKMYASEMIAFSLFFFSFIFLILQIVVDRGFKPWSGQTKDYKFCIICFSALRSKNRYWLARNHDEVSMRSDLFIRWLLFQWASTIKIQLSVWWSRKRRFSSGLLLWSPCCSFLSFSMFFF